MNYSNTAQRITAPKARYFVEIRQGMYRVINNTTGTIVASSNSFFVASRMRDSKNAEEGK